MSAIDLDLLLVITGAIMVVAGLVVSHRKARRLPPLLTTIELRSIPTTLLMLDTAHCGCNPACTRCVGKLAEIDERIPVREMRP